jgi:hypothetical protein
MNDAASQPPKAEPIRDGDAERTKQVTVAGWTAGLSALFALGAVGTSPAWPTAFGVAAVSAMVAVVCYFILKR